MTSKQKPSPNKDFEDLILELLLKETNYKIKDLIGLIIYLVHNYHPDFKLIVKGRKKRWNPLIEASLAVQIDILRANGCKSRREAAALIAQDNLWRKMCPEYNRNSISGIEQFIRMDKKARLTSNKTIYEKVTGIHSNYLKKNDLRGWEKFVSKIIDLQKKNGDISLDLNPLEFKN